LSEWLISGSARAFCWRFYHRVSLKTFIPFFVAARRRSGNPAAGYTSIDKFSMENFSIRVCVNQPI
jgi:hypothetical protein